MADDGGIWIKAESTAASASAYVKTANGWEEVSGGAGFQPGSPGTPDLDPSASGSVIEFGAPSDTGDSPVLSYGASIDPEGPVLTVDVADPALGGEISITGLVVGETYVVSVYAVNTQGRGPAASTDPWEESVSWNDASGGLPSIVDDYWGDGTNEQWKVHSFTSSGLQLFEVRENPSPFRVLSVGGGGEGGKGAGGGGGGGMVREYSDEEFPSGTTHDVFVGGAAGQTYMRIRNQDSNGSGTGIVRYTAQPGGKGSDGGSNASTTTGTGGGGGKNGNGGFGSNGGNGGDGNSNAGGGGGATFANGGGASNSNGGTGASGLISDVTGVATYYGGGGGGGRSYGSSTTPDGGLGGLGGGGTGGSAADNAEAGSNGRGGGGGGGGVNFSNSDMPGKSGGSGCLVIAYQIGYNTKIAGERARKQREMLEHAKADAYAQGQVDTHEAYVAKSEPEE